MDFTSDNAAALAPEVMLGLQAANAGTASGYGNDDLTKRVETAFSDLFGREVGVFLVSTGGAANGLALSALTPSWGAILCHREAHVMVDEAAGVEFFLGGGRLVGLSGIGAKVTPSSVEAGLAAMDGRVPHQIPARTLSLTQATEYGRVYSADEIATLCETAKRHGLKVHMDGARFANAVAATGAEPADLTWRAGVDALSFGFTKNGALCAEAVIAFDLALNEELTYRRKRSGHLWSKHRFLSAQVLAMLEGNAWLKHAGHANRMAALLAEALSENNGAELVFPPDANEIFCRLTPDLDVQLRAAGCHYYDWPGDPETGAGDPTKGQVNRFVTSFATTEADIAAVRAALVTRATHSAAAG
ncbi:MAG: beta-eliminating lyase-related protein [Pseudomonadota bacterium]